MASTSLQDQISSLIALAIDLQSEISNATTPSPNTLPSSSLSLSLNKDTRRNLDKYLDKNKLLGSGSALPFSSRRELDEKGTALWNACARLMSICHCRGRLRDGGMMGVLSRVNAFAFEMLDCAAGGDGKGNSRALKLALKAARVCIENKQLDLGLKILRTAAARLDALEESGTDIQIQSLTTEYYMLRVYLSWLQGRPDIAEHMFSKVPEPNSKEHRKAILEICYNVSKSAVSGGQYDTAVKWLERAVESSALLSPGLQQLGQDMRLLVLHALAWACLRINSTDSRRRLFQILDVLKADYGNSFAVLILQLEILSKEANPKVNDYYECLRAVFRIMDFADENLKIVFYYILKLKDWSLELSSQALQQFLQGLGRSNRKNWIEQSFVTLVWILTDLAFCPQDGLDRLTDSLFELSKWWPGPLSKEAAHACLILIWRKVDAAISRGDHCIAERWCQFVLGHPVFQSCTTANKAKFQRRLVICAMENSNHVLARETLDHMPEECRSDPLTLYIRYKLALVDEDPDHATTCLQSLSQLGAPGTAYILSCVAEARRLGRTQQVINGFQYIITNLSIGCCEGVHIPGLFQSAVHLLSMELENYKTGKTENDIIEQISGALDAALREAAELFSPVELEWFSRNSYNIALRSLKSASSESVLLLLNVSAEFADLYARRVDSTKQPNIYQHFLLCDFLRSIILVSQARMQNDPVIKETHYHSIRTCSQSFRTRISWQLERCTESEHLEWLKKYRTMLSFDFEAAVLLKQWDSLVPIIDEARGILDDRLISTFVDCILSSGAPVRDMVRVVELIISISMTPNSVYISPSFFPGKLPRYFRCLFQLCISMSTSSPPTTPSLANSIPRPEAEAESRSGLNLAESILTHALTLAHQTQTSEHAYPKEELEWLATVAFNQAVDLYIVSAEEDCKRWAGKAIELADLVGCYHVDDNGNGSDNGALGRLLRGNLARLGITIE